MTVYRHIGLIHARIERIAARAPMPTMADDSLDRTLAELTDAGRRRVTILLDRINAFSEDPNERAAVEHIRRRAARAWYGASVSFNGDSRR
jgi:hypothetical protein